MIGIERTFDCVPQWDERNLEYPIRTLIGTPEIQEKIWELPECLDQGQEGACVGFGWTHELYAEPDRVEGVDPREIYLQAQKIDEWPGENYSGTSVLAGAKVVQERGHLIEYRWALDIQDVLSTLSAHGPVVVGVNWHRGMENTDRDGYIHPTGPTLGGHCVCLRGVIREPSDLLGWTILGRNSWGLNWGLNGDFKIRASDFQTLMTERGEICVPVVRVRPTVVSTLGTYRKKPIEIQAVRWTGENPDEVRNFIGSLDRDEQNRVAIVTLEGTMKADVGDWIIRGVQGEVYPCKPQIFDATYELVVPVL